MSKHPKRGGGKLLDERGPEYFRELGRKSGQKLLETKGRDHFVEMGRRSQQRIKQLLERGRAAEEIDQELADLDERAVDP